MSFITGVQIIHALASALNNAGIFPSQVAENAVGIKVICINDRYYPYVSAQAYRYWLRQTLEK